ncbi:MAG: DUF2203 domain-containing protein [Chloroflexi bacterium]|nr:DUF2203 domain-containing protein [Chloroflexota bacterium]
MVVYSLEEARLLLPRVVPVLEAIRDLIAELKALSAATAIERRGATADGSRTEDPWADAGEDHARTLNRRLTAAAQQLDEWGVELKDPETGLVDFYHERDGTLVYLCYRLGERDIEYWHTLEGGFAARQRIEC